MNHHHPRRGEEAKRKNNRTILLRTKGCIPMLVRRSRLLVLASLSSLSRSFSTHALLGRRWNFLARTHYYSMPPQSTTPEEISPVDRLTYKLRNHWVDVTLHPTEETEECCKTLVWKATTTIGSLSSSTSSSSSLNNNTTKQPSPRDQDSQASDSFFYFCTALRVQDRVDQSLLRQVLRTHKLQADQTLSSLSFAPTDVAESLTGYTTGTIPPVGHSVPLLTVLDPALLVTNSHVRLGSGDAAWDLRVSATDLLRFAQDTAQVLVQPITAAGVTAATTQDNGNKDIPVITLTPPPTSQYDMEQLQPQPIMNDETNNESSSSRCNKKAPKPLSAAWLEKPLAKRLRDVAGREDYHHLIQACIEEAGDDLPTLLYGGKDGGYTKTPVHNAAWRGTTVALDLFLQAGERLGHDFLNCIAVGNGNHGKTPIFYALTRSREEMVSHCIDKGANLLIVNNKGQTPSSLAVSHVSPELCARMWALEEEQLRAGGSFQNFRASHTDGHKYGDLDPRFPIDNVNMGDDVKQVLEDFAKIRDDLPTVQGIPVGDGFPRSIRTTTNEIRSAMACERWGKAPKLKYLMRQQEASISASSFSKNSHPEERVETKKKTQKSALPPIAMDELDVLQLKDVVADPEKNVLLVDDLHSLQHFQTAVNTAVENVEKVTASKPTLSDHDLAQHTWGVDAEWRPTSMSDKNMPVAVLQLCSPEDKIFLLDLQTLCHPSQGNPELQPSSLELLLSVTLSKLFQATEISLAGFGIIQDLGKLAHSFPHLPCFYLFESVIDLQAVAPKALDDRRIKSLQNYVAVLMKKKLDKTEQCSDWAVRPLSPMQMVYAALDAAVARPLLLATLEEQQKSSSSFVDSEEEGTEEPSFLVEHNELRQTIRMTFLREEETYDRSIRYRVVMGHEKTQLGVRYARQSWPTGQSPPEEPSQSEEQEIGSSPMPPDVSPNGAPKPKGKAKSYRRKQRGKKGIPLKQLAGDLEGLPLGGEVVGYTKDDCVKAVLGPNVVNSMADNFSLRFNRRGGIVEMSNAWLLFISFSGYTKEWKYQNEFSNEGRWINFSVDTQSGFKENELPFLFELSCLDESLDYVPSVKPERQILLFARRNSDSKFVYCGRCECREWTSPATGEYDLQLELLEFDDLVQSPEYPHIGEDAVIPYAERKEAY
eukprot:scaffold5079_cov169-Amphora_coffeaeformis.AAC.9